MMSDATDMQYISVTVSCYKIPALDIFFVVISCLCSVVFVPYRYGANVYHCSMVGVLCLKGWLE